jgi:hypothetical protein
MKFRLLGRTGTEKLERCFILLLQAGLEQLAEYQNSLSRRGGSGRPGAQSLGPVAKQLSLQLTQ